MQSEMNSAEEEAGGFSNTELFSVRKILKEFWGKG